jgi:hypothetical protein
VGVLKSSKSLFLHRLFQGLLYLYICNLHSQVLYITGNSHSELLYVAGSRYRVNRNEIQKYEKKSSTRLLKKLICRELSMKRRNGNVSNKVWNPGVVQRKNSIDSAPLWSSGQSSWLQIGDVLCSLWGRNWIYICYVEERRPLLWSSGQSSWLQIGDVLCFLWGRNWIYICYVEERGPPLWSIGQSSWLQIGNVLCFLWGTNWIYIRYVEESRPPNHHLCLSCMGLCCPLPH